MNTITRVAHFMLRYYHPGPGDTGPPRRCGRHGR